MIETHVKNKTYNLAKMAVIFPGSLTLVVFFFINNVELRMLFVSHDKSSAFNTNLCFCENGGKILGIP